jgi:hypothetical protein
MYLLQLLASEELGDGHSYVLMIDVMKLTADVPYD